MGEGTVSAGVRSPPRWRRARALVGVLIIAAAVVYLIVTSIHGSAVFYVTISEAKAQGGARDGVRVSGLVDGDSIRWDAAKMLLRFSLVDGPERLDVTYHGLRPDMLRDGATAIVEGKLVDGDTFEARDVLLQCPSKYEAAATATARS